MIQPAAERAELDLSVLVVAWQSRSTLPRCLESISSTLAELREDGVDGEAVLVDNASQDGTADLLEATWGGDPRFRLVLNRDNLGFAGGNNQAMRASAGRTIAVVNPDTAISAPTVRACLTHLDEHPEVGIVTCRLRQPDGTEQVTHRAFPTLDLTLATQTRLGRAVDHRLLHDRMLHRYKLADLPEAPFVPIDQAAGAFMVMRRSLVDLIGGYLFDETMPLYFNDVDLCRRVRDQGLEVHLLRDHSIEHVGGVALRQVEADTRRVERWRGLLAYYERHEGRVPELVVRAVAPPDARRAPSARLAPGLSRDRPLVSIVVPTYNYANWLGEAVDSALAQTYDPIEVIVVDDGSTDATPEVVAGYGDRVHSLRQPNRGLSNARNRGASLARGEVVAFLDADNRLAPTFVTRTLDALRADPYAAFAYTQLHYFGDADACTTKPAWSPEVLRKGNYIDACALIHIDLVRRFPYDESNRVGWEDWDFWLTLAEHGYRGVLVDEPLVDYRRHDEAMTASIVSLRKLDLRAAVMRRHRRYVGYQLWWQAEVRRMRQRAGLARRRVTGRSRPSG